MPVSSSDSGGLTGCKDVDELRAQVKRWRGDGESIAFVPTMGNLHAGHLSLVELAQQEADRVVVSIYVNPLQFAPDEDFSSYPRTLDDDMDKLRAAAVDLVFTPDSEMIYPQGEQHSSFVEVPVLSHIIEGEFRPGFFRGVATVVLKLFNLVQPDIAVFGEKDFQQLLIIRRMVSDMKLPIGIIGAETKRTESGLAMSSRNAYLDADELEKSRLLSETLNRFRDLVEQGNDIDGTEEECRQFLQNQGFAVDYMTLRETSALEIVKDGDIIGGNELIILAAARLGGTRLIDNLKFIA